MSSGPIAQKNNDMNQSPNQLGSPNRMDQALLDDEPNRPNNLKNDFRADLTYNMSETETGTLGIAMRLKDQNLNLKAQLKELKYHLRETLEKVQAKKKAQDVTQKSVDPKENGLVKELEAQHRQISNYKKEITNIKNNLEAYHNEERVIKLENILRDKNRIMEKLSEEKRNLERVKLTQDKELDSLQKEFAYEKKLGNQKDEARSLRHKIKAMVETNRMNDKTFQRQQEYLVALNNQYRIICDKLGIAPTMNFTRAEDLNNIITKKTKEAKEKKAESAYIKRLITENDKYSKAKNGRSKSVRESKDSKRPLYLEPTQENMQALQANIDAQQKKCATVEQDYIKELTSLEAQKKELFLKFKELEAKLKDKEKEASILNHRASEMKRNIRFGALAPLNSDDKNHYIVNGKGDPVFSNLISPAYGTHRSADRGTRPHMIKNLKESSKKRDHSANSNDGFQSRRQADEVRQGY